MQFKYKFINHAIIIRLDVPESKDAFKLFETINNRGLTLSPADIIKNFLLGNASLVDDATLEAVKDDWTKLVVALDGISMDDFFRQYVIGLVHRRISGTLLIDTFKKYYARHIAEGVSLRSYSEYADADEADEPLNEQMHLTEFAADLRKAAVVYQQIVNAATGDIKIDRHLENLRKIRSVASYTFVLSLLRRDIDRKDKLAILGMLETFMLRRNVAEYRTGELEDIFAKLTKLPDEGIVENTYVQFRDNLPSDEEFHSRLLSHDFKGQLENRAKYMLEQLEYHITGNTGEKYIAGGEEVHLEHIMPQTIDTKKSKLEFGDWQEYLGPENVPLHGQYLAKLGNLTLLAAPLNIHASNNPFKSKQYDGVEANDSKAKETDYSKSNIELTRQLLAYDEWKFPQIEARSEELAQLALKIWQLPEYDVPEPLTIATATDGMTVYCASDEAEATGTWYDDGRLVVMKGSLAARLNSASFTGGYSELKDRLLKNNILKEQGTNLVFAEDYEFDSPSAAAAVVLGRSAAGPREWRDANGKDLHELTA